MKRLSPSQDKARRLVAAGRFVPDLVREDDGWHARWRPADRDPESTDDGGETVAAWLDEFVRSATMTPLSEDAEDQRHETLHDAWILALRSRTGLVRWDDAECAAFADELRAWAGVDDVAARRAILFSFRGAAPSGETPFEIVCAVPRGRVALKALGQSAYVWGPLRELRARGSDELAVALAPGEAEDFLRRGARDLCEAGYSVAGVPESARVTAEAEIAADAVRGTSAGRPQPCSLRLTVRVDGERVTAGEIRFLLEQNSTLVFFRDRWIEVDRGILREALRALERAGVANARVNPLTFAMGIGAVGRLEVEEVTARGGLRGLVNELRAASGGAAAPTHAPGSVPGLAGELRDYQARGVAWLRFLTAHGFGALLADDMGLGKTIQAIAWLLAAKADGALKGPALVAAPLTLVANWRHELAAFAPSLKVYVHHGEARHFASGFREAARVADVVVTSYSLVVRDHAAFSEVAWGAAVLDEAQAMKNPDTQLARALRALLPPLRVALTGTPIENTVGDVWSLEEFLNPGFLGERKSFVERFAKPLAEDPSSPQAKRLRHALEPFVLRRLKSDPGIAAELGEKREIREYCELDAEGRAAYEAALADFRAGARRQGDVFALLTELKLICDGAGKFERLAELLAQIFESGESALVFTQYAKVGRRLQEQLAARFGRSFPFLHGELTASAREREIARFNAAGPGAFILSLKAGGFGLNLTKATHVIHFDRWWNPAVESQATDRAHRIGQSKSVFVHVFVTPGTLEERIDEILRRKESLEGLLKNGDEFARLVALAPA